MHYHGAIAVSETITLRGENIMKKVVTTVTALVFALGLTTAGYTQTTVKKEDKPAVQTQAPAASSTVKPMEKGKADEMAKPVAKEGEPAKGKKPETQMTKKEADKKPAVLETKKDSGKKPVTPETKKEEKKDVVK